MVDYFRTMWYLQFKKREEFLGVREDDGIELHYAICTVYYNFSMSAVLVSNINALPFICIFKDM